MADTHILLTNDDGIDAFGLIVMEKALGALSGLRLTTVAPATQQSATSRCMTLHEPLRVRQHGDRRWSVTGTPTDTVLVALGKILADDLPDFVLSGINHGPNLGEDVHYSGTVAAAMEGCMQGIPAAAISLADWRPADFGATAAFLRRMMPTILKRPLPAGTMWNINVPDGPESSLRGVRITRQGSRHYYDVVNEMTDPRGRPMVWISGKGPKWQDLEESDYAAVRDGYASMTPLRTDLTDRDTLGVVRDLACDDLPGAPACAGDADGFVRGSGDPQGLTFEGPTRGNDAPSLRQDDHHHEDSR
jgi:5'-nucleotidase